MFECWALTGVSLQCFESFETRELWSLFENPVHGAVERADCSRARCWILWVAAPALRFVSRTILLFCLAGLIPALISVPSLKPINVGVFASAFLGLSLSSSPRLFFQIMTNHEIKKTYKFQRTSTWKPEDSEWWKSFKKTNSQRPKWTKWTCLTLSLESNLRCLRDRKVIHG